MKFFLRKSLLIFGLLSISVACNRDETNAKSTSETIIEDNPSLGFSVFQYTNLYNALGLEEGKFTEKLKAENIDFTFDENEYEYAYYTENKNYPETHYLVKFTENQAVDYTTTPASRYPALSKFVMTPVDKNKQPIKVELANVETYFRFFYEKAKTIEPDQKPMEYLLYNRLLGAKGYFENLDNLDDFLKELTNPNKPNINGRIVWNLNPDSRVFPREGRDDRQASAEQNKPIQRIIYNFAEKTIQVEIELNVPLDVYRLRWK